MPKTVFGVPEDCFGCAALSEPLCAARGARPFYKTRAGADAEIARGLAVERGYYAHGNRYEPRGKT